MKIVGLTGGIASGKSTVTKWLAARGFPIIDADVVSREVVEPGSAALAEIAARFPGVVGADGRLDRAALGARIFGHASERAALDAIVHPRVRVRVAELTETHRRSGAKLVIYDAPLLIENKLYEGLDGVILVEAPRAVQRDRLMARNGLTAEQADARIGSQLSLEAKRPFATWRIDNGGSLDATERQVAALCTTLDALAS